MDGEPGVPAEEEQEVVGGGRGEAELRVEGVHQKPHLHTLPSTGELRNQTSQNMLKCKIVYCK